MVMAAMVLVGCDGVRGASDFAKREAFNANFNQLPLVRDGLAEDRTLQMFVFSGAAEPGPRRGYPVRFSAAIRQ